MIRMPAILAAALCAVLPMTMVTAGPAEAKSAGQPRTMHLETVFPRITSARGSFAAINGVKRSFDVRLRTTWDGRTLTMIEDFVFDDGEKDRKTWRFVKTGPNTYSGTREDVIGTTTVTVDGRRASFSYLVYLDPKNKANKVRFRDTLILQDNGAVANTAIVSKYGFPVAKVTVDFKAP